LRKTLHAGEIFSNYQLAQRFIGGSRNIGSLDMTITSIDWDIDEAWSADTWYTSPDIASVIQEVINRGDWSDGSSLAIIYSTRLRESGYRNISSFDRGSDCAPKLEITYVLPPEKPGSSEPEGEIADKKG